MPLKKALKALISQLFGTVLTVSFMIMIVSPLITGDKQSMIINGEKVMFTAENILEEFLIPLLIGILLFIVVFVLLISSITSLLKGGENFVATESRLIIYDGKRIRSIA